MLNPETFSKHYPLALIALAAHIEEHQLPLPRAIDTEYSEHGQPVSLTVVLGSFDHQAWIESVHVDDVDDQYREPQLGRLEPYLRTSWKVRLPATGHVFTLRASRDLPFGSAVSA